ncbi:MAG: DNA mismatch repair protein MutS [Thermoplasmata archaeon]
MSAPAVSTPLLDQYEAVKARYPGHLVLFRVGDFYETFGEDAKLLSRELEVVLTARSADAQGQRTPMAGVPHHAVESYLGRLVRKGYKVALCDQVEDARFAKGLVRREVTRVVTPGTVVEDRILGTPDHNFLACVEILPEAPGAFAVVDVTTGEWFHGTAASTGVEGIVTALAPFQPREILVTVPSGESSGGGLLRTLAKEFPRARLEPAPAPLPVEELPISLSTIPTLSASLAAVGSRLAAYVRSTQPRLLPYLEPVDSRLLGKRQLLDAKTLRHLEINRPMNPDDPKGTTLLDVWDSTVTAPGRRTLRFWLQNPLAEVERIEERLSAVQALVERRADLLVLRTTLGRVADISRIGARLAGRRIRPVELGTLRESLREANRVGEMLTHGPSTPWIDRLAKEAVPPASFLDRLNTVLPDTLPVSDEDHGLFRPGHAAELDQILQTERAALAELEALERAEQARTGIRTLKIGYNQVFGYYFEISRPNLDKAPSDFRRKQTLAGAERFTSDRLGELERQILTSREKARETEAGLWEQFLSEVERELPRIHRVARAIGIVDALASFALLAQEQRLVRPTVDDSTALVIREGRHPILDRMLSGRFVPNDIEMDAADARLLVLTGPNMSGKSTFMRQVGLLVVLAQAGSFVPAKFARIGVVSSLFTRMGFTDEIGRGKSSFMVEMSEVAQILRAADPKSLILLDEVGRGTSTFDGLALAWATIRYLHDTVQCRSVLATHYHPLTELIEDLRGASNVHLAVEERDGGIVFLHQVVPGSTDRSYGVHVARLAGMPPSVVREADLLLRRLEEGGVNVTDSKRKARGPTRYTQAILLADARAPSISALEAEIRSLDLDRLTPLEALRRLHELQQRARAESPPEGP